MMSIKETPEFATICSYVDLFGEELSVSLTHKQLAWYLEIQDLESVPKPWIDIHRRLLNRVKFQASFDKWELKLRKFLSSLFGMDLIPTIDIDFSSYLALKPKERALILNLLLDAQFDRNVKFKEKISLKTNDSLRIRPFGSDMYGSVYWMFTDKEHNILMYKENLEDETFKVIAETVDDMRRLKEELDVIDLDSIDLFKLYKLPEETDSPPTNELMNGIATETLCPKKIESVEVKNENVVGSVISQTNGETKMGSVKNEVVSEILEKEELNYNGNDGESENDLIIAEYDKTEDIIMHDNSLIDKKEMEMVSTEVLSNNEDNILKPEEPLNEEINAPIDDNQIQESESNDNVCENVQVKESVVEKELIAELPKEVQENNVESSSNTCPSTPVKKRGRKSKAAVKLQLEVEMNDSQMELRRSSRQRKPVALFTIEDKKKHGKESKTFVDDELEEPEIVEKVKKSKRKEKKESLKAHRKPKKEAYKELKNKKIRLSKEEREQLKLEKRMAKLKHKEKHNKNKKKSRKLSKGKMPWEMAESSEEEVVDKTEEEMYDLFLDNVESESENNSKLLAEATTNELYDADKPESDFDADKLSQTSDEETMKSRGRNYCRQKRRQKCKKEAIEQQLIVETVLVEVETICQICLASNVPEMLLLCDSCDLGHHAMCLRPSLMIIPEGDWFCPKCCHRKLLDQLQLRIPELEKLHVKTSATLRMQERLNFVNISMSNIISDRRSKSHSKRKLKGDSSEEDDDVINSSAIGDDDDSGSGSENGSSPSITSSSSGTADSSKSTSDKRPYKFRESSRKETHKYNFEELDKIFDEALVNDEKYQMLKKEKESGQEFENEEGESEDEYDYSGLVPRKKSSGKDMSNLLREDGDDEEDGEGDSEKKVSKKDEDEDENEDDEDIKTDVNEKPILLKPPRLLARSQRKRKSSFDDSCNEDDKDEDFRLSEEEQNDFSDDEIKADMDDDDDGDEDWLQSKKSTRKSTRKGGRGVGRSSKRRHIEAKKNRRSRKSVGGSSRKKQKLADDLDDDVRRPRRSAAKKVNYRELIGEDEDGSENEDNEDASMDDNDESVPRGILNRKRLSRDELNEEQNEAEDKPPPVVNRGTVAGSKRKLRMSDSEYEASVHSSLEEEDEIEEEGEDEGGSSSTDKQEGGDNKTSANEPPAKMMRLEEDGEVSKTETPISVNKPSVEDRVQNDKNYQLLQPSLFNIEKEQDFIKNTQINESLEKQEPVKIDQEESNPLKIIQEDDQKISVNNLEEDPASPELEEDDDEDRDGSSCDDSLTGLVEDESGLAQLCSDTPPVLSVEEVDVCVKNPMRASQLQQEDVEDDLDSDTECSMLHIKR